MAPRFQDLTSSIRLLRYLFLPVILLGAVGVGLSLPNPSAWTVVAIAAVAVAWFATLQILLSVTGLLVKIESSSYRSHDAVLDTKDHLAKQTAMLESIARYTQLSDDAKGIAFRDQERDLIRRAFSETLIGGDYEAAAFLADQLEKRHGYKQEADRLRAEIEAAQNELETRHVRRHVERVDRLLEEHQWEGARLEIEQLQRLNPSDPRVPRLLEALRLRRADHKRRLLKEWDESVQRNEIDRGIAILRELDQYLTPNEAAALEESARGVFRAKLHNLGVQFSLAVHDRQWTEALDIGQEIINEFPNSRMAAEVREHLEALKARASRSVEAAANT